MWVSFTVRGRCVGVIYSRGGVSYTVGGGFYNEVRRAVILV